MSNYVVPFNNPAITGNENIYIADVLQGGKLSGDGLYTRKCHDWLVTHLNCYKALLTTSCTHALEMAAILANIQVDDEIILPSYTFVSTANAFVLRGAKIVFVDIRKDTMNIDELLIEEAITPKTKAIVVVHYAGISCEMDTINQIAGKYNLIVIEDAAQGVMSMYKNKHLGTIGDIGCYSFHDTKNLNCGEGGAIIIKDSDTNGRAEIIREKGTNRTRFLMGQIDKYTWVDIGSSYLPSELNAAMLFAQLEMAQEITRNRIQSWNYYYELLTRLEQLGIIELPFVPAECEHNAHMFYIKVSDIEERSRLMSFLKRNGISAAFHYIPLHKSDAGKRFGKFHGADNNTTIESERLLRLPLYYNMQKNDIDMVVNKVQEFYYKSN